MTGRQVSQKMRRNLISKAARYWNHNLNIKEKPCVWLCYDIVSTAKIIRHLKNSHVGYYASFELRAQLDVLSQTHGSSCFTPRSLKCRLGLFLHATNTTSIYVCTLGKHHNSQQEGALEGGEAAEGKKNNILSVLRVTRNIVLEI